MKTTYKLEYRTGWGEHCEIAFQARTLYDAHVIAKNYCTHHFIKNAWIVTSSGKVMAV